MAAWKLNSYVMFYSLSCPGLTQLEWTGGDQEQREDRDSGGLQGGLGTLQAELYLSIPYQLLPVGMRHRDKAAGEKGDRGRTGMREQGAAQPNLEKHACWRLGGEGRLARSVLTMAQGTGT